LLLLEDLRVSEANEAAVLAALATTDDATFAAVFDGDFYDGWRSSTDLVHVLAAFGFAAHRSSSAVEIVGLNGDWVTPPSLGVLEKLAPWLPAYARVALARYRDDYPCYGLTFVGGVMAVSTDVTADTQYCF